MGDEGKGKSAFWLKEDWWAVFLGLGIICIGVAFYAGGIGAALKFFSVSPPKWSQFSLVADHFAGAWPGYLVLFLGFLAIFTASTRVMGFSPRQYVPGFVVIFVSSMIILVLSNPPSPRITISKPRCCR